MVLVGWFSVDHRFTVVFGRIQGSRNQIKFVKNVCENRVRQRYAELSANGTKMEANSEQEIVNIMKITEKKKYPQIDTKKSAGRNCQKRV